MKLGKPYPKSELFRHQQWDESLRLWFFTLHLFPSQQMCFFSFLAAAGTESWWNFDAIEILSN